MKNNNTIRFITGGCRSGKSSFAEKLAKEVEKPRCYIATAEIFDDEMRYRVNKHKEQRKDEFHTIEAPIDLANAIASVPSESKILLIDCITVWLGNLMYHKSDEFSDDCPEILNLLESLKSPACDIIIVSNELGMGIVPESAMSRQFRDVAGRLNQKLAALSNEAFLTVSGLPLKLK